MSLDSLKKKGFQELDPKDNLSAFGGGDGIYGTIVQCLCNGGIGVYPNCEWGYTCYRLP